MKEDSFFKMAKDFEDADFCAQLSLVSVCGFLVHLKVYCAKLLTILLYHQGVNAIMHDFTQEYRKAAEVLPNGLPSQP